MKTLIIAAALVLAGAARAHAGVWDFAWHSDANAVQYVGIAAPDTTLPSHTTGTTTATFAPAGGSSEVISFDTPAGPGTIDLLQGPSMPFQVTGLGPIFLPDPPPGTSLRYGKPGWNLEPVAYGDYRWTGDFAHPDSFTVSLVGGGSGPTNAFVFSGVGTLRGDPPTTQAPEPGVLVIAGTSLVGALVLRPRRR